VVTIARGRVEHLRGQAWGLVRQSRQADLHVVVSMGDPEVTRVARELLPRVRTPSMDVTGDDLPLSAARNAGAAAALEEGADHLVFLDVDCIPGEGTLARYDRVLRDVADRHHPVVACGEVSYLPPVAHPSEYRQPGLSDLASPHPARPRLDPDDVVEDGDVRLFWSLSFAVTAKHWRRIGGFSEDYTGYGAEDTDFGQRVASAGGSLLWTGGAAAYHQHHPTSSPPTQHLHSIISNANTFRDTWGWFPMEGWLDGFAARGLAHLDPTTDRWVVSAQRSPSSR
jgi:hypothetical protein